MLPVLPFRLPLFSALALAVWATPAPDAAARDTTIVAPALQVAAHRGGAMHRPENTLPAFAHAQALGVDYLELDLVMTADDALAVYHDDTLNPGICQRRDGTAVSTVPMRTLTLAQLQQLDCGSSVRKLYDVPGFQPHPGAPMPTLADVLDALASTPARFFVETKVPAPTAGVADVDPTVFARLIDAQVRQHGLEDRFILQSKDARTLTAMAQINPRIRTCLYGKDITTSADAAATLRQVGATCTLMPADSSTPAQVAALRAAGILVFSEVVDDAAGWQRYVDHGADVLITNHPEGVLAWLRERQSAHTPPAGGGQ